LNSPEPSDYEAEIFFAGVYRRLVWAMCILPLLATPLLWVRYGRTVAVAFMAGSAVALLNFYWLKQTVTAAVDRMTNTGDKPSTSFVVGRFLLRYALLAAAAYVIVKSSAHSVYGFFGGLLLPVGAILIEAVYGTYGALRRKL